MAYRDLTKRFVTLRGSYRPVSIPIRDGGSMSSEQAKDHLLTATGSPTAPTDSTDSALSSLPPEWSELVESIDDDINKVETQLQVLENYHDKRLRVTFEDHSATDRAIQETTKQITSLCKQCQAKLKRVAALGSDSGSSELSYQERIVRVNVMRSRGVKVSGLTKRFRQAQRQYLEKIQTQEMKGGKWISEDVNNTLPSLDRIEYGFTEQQMQQLNDIENDTNQRTKEIIAIAKSVNELAQLFNELSVLIVEQGSLLDRIDYNVEMTVENLKAAKVEIDKAEKHQKASRSALCILVLFLLIFVCGFIVIIRQSLK